MISIVIPVYNAAEYLPAMLDSVLTQSYTDIELILVNDGSKDNSSEICHAYAQKYPCVRVYDRENRGASATRNFGLEQAAGEFVWFMDSDDILTENALQTAVELQKKYDADVVIGGMNFCFTEEGRTVLREVKQEWAFSPSEFKDYYKTLFLHNYISSLWNKLIRRSVVMEHDLRMLENLQMYEDYVFCMDLLMCCEKIVCTPVSFYDYQLRDSGSLSHRHKQGVPEMFRLLKQKITGYREAFAQENAEADACLSNLMIYLAYESVKNEARSKEKPAAKVRALLRDKDFREAMANFYSDGWQYRAVHMMMKYRLALPLMTYLRLTGKSK